MAKFAAYIFLTEQDIHNLASALKTTRSFLHRIKMSWTLVYRRFKIGPSFLPTLPWILQSTSLLGRLRIRSSANRTQPKLPNGRKYIALTARRKDVGVVPPKSWGPKLYTFVRFFRRLRDLMANIFGKNHGIDNQETIGKRRRKQRGVPYTISKLHELWPTNGLKLDHQFRLLTLRKFCILLHCQASYTEVSKQNSTKLCYMLGSEQDL